MAYASSTIGSLINDVNRTHFLPAIQRPFVWSSNQVIALFDSLMKGYPISSFMFWAVDEATKAEVRCYKFLEHYKPDIRNEITSAEGRSVVLVLDGQQRLTSLLIGLRGTFLEKAKGARVSNASAWSAKTLFIDLLKDADGADEEDDSDLGVTYGLSFHDRRPANTARHHWFKVGTILDYETEDRLEALIARIKSELSEKVGSVERQLAEDTIRQLHRVIWQDQAINFYTETDQSPDRVLDIFVRANDGGTKLSKADLLMSMITSKWSSGSAREDILGFVDYVNRGLGAPNKVTKDFVLKASLVLCDFDVTYNVRNFTSDTIAEIERNWSEIKRAIENTFRLLNRHGLVADNLGSLNAVLPLTYYLYNTPDFDFRGSSEFERANGAEMHYWLLNSLIVGAFSGNSDQTITLTRNTIRDHLRIARERSFPAQKLFDAVARSGRIAQVDAHAIETMLEWEYGKPRTFLALSLLYHGIDWSGSTWHIDHIIPQAEAQKSVLRGRNLAEHHIQDILNSVNRLGNLQLLRSDENIEKGALPFRSWITGRRVDFYDQHMIPERLDMCDVLRLPEFVAAREKLIRQRVSNLLGMGKA
ncbi:DUF262 domain-containing protein [Paragemmobacter straminiformis]|uniref:DUF262 domain-containing protein n=1 Tax=Paragemmobacter straminiformis TaxID=2045119 RepID=A0A842I245_9RHOB|nr:DUF262 domain-containing protein [Gemmobacter straminiformis]MBC2834070.1 DUF262 domain-containing protein [Gemmobacter straminiformis]